MTNWEQPHWSGRPQEKPDGRARLKPNIFARLARFSARHAAAVILLVLFLASLGAGLAVFSIRLLPASAPAISLDDQTAKAQAALDTLFPGIDRVFYATITNKNSAYARDSAIGVANQLRRHANLFETAFVPGTGPFYDRFGLLYQPAEEVAARVNLVLQLQPLFHALASAPNLEGLAALTQQIANAVAQGRSPPLLEGVLGAAADAVEGEISGAPKPVDWPLLAGLRPVPELTRWFIVAKPVAGQEAAAADAARVISSRINKLDWSFPPHTLDGKPARLTRDLAVPALLSAMVVLIILGGGLASVRQSLAVLAASASCLALSFGIAAGTRPTFDAVTWSLAVAVLAPGFLFSLIVVIGFGEARARGKSVNTALMLAAHRAGPRILGFAAIAEALWLFWLPRQIDSLVLLAEGVSVGIVVAALLSLTLVPALLAAGNQPEEPDDFHWLDDAVATPAGNNLRNARALLALLAMAGALFCAIFIPNVKFGDPQLRTLQAGALDTPTAIGAVHILVKPEAAPALIENLKKLPEVGAIRSIGQFLPVDAEAKINSLRGLAELLPATAAPQPGTEGALPPDVLASLDANLLAIANDPSTGEGLRAAAQRLRRSLQLFANAEAPSPARIGQLEDAIFTGLGGLAAEADRLGSLAPPAIADLDEGLRSHFVAPDGQWRIEVLPKPGVTSLSFAAVLRKLSPDVAGVPVVALARNEIMHHESILALGPALALAGLIALAMARRPHRMVVALVPTALALCLCAAALVTSGELIDATALAALSTAIALSFAASLTLALGTDPPKEGGEGEMNVSFRAAILPLALSLAVTAPLVVSGNPAIAEFSYVASLFLMAAILCNALIGMQLSIWLEDLLGRDSGE
jgi:uncharacterized protein